MFYVVKSNSKSLRDKIVKKIISSRKIEDENVFVFDFEESGDFEKAFSEYLTFNFTNEKKIVILKNANFINVVKPDKLYEERFSKSINIKNKNVLILEVDKFNKTGKLNKKFKNDFELIEKDSPKNNELIKFVEHFFTSRNIQISYELSKRIVEKLNEDFDIIVSEINKLELICGDKINSEIIDSSIIDLSKENLFKLAGAVLTLDEEKISILINKLRVQGEEFYLVGERLAMEFSKVLRYKVITDLDKGIGDLEFQKLTNWNMWGIKNYSNWIKNWPSQEIMCSFFYDVILRNSFFYIVEGNPDDPLRLLEKILVNNVLKVKRGQYES